MTARARSPFRHRPASAAVGDRLRVIQRPPVSDIEKAKYPILDAHCHGSRPIEQLPQWVRMMDDVGVEKAVIFLRSGVADRFAEAAKPYRQYGNRF